MDIDYIATPRKILKTIPDPGGKDSKMSKKESTVPTAKTRKVYSKTRGEHIKDIVIAMLITGIVAFYYGMQFQQDHNIEIRSAVEQAQAVATDTPVKK